MKVTPEYIDALKPNEVFVFGSNESGLHYGGAAKTAMKWGAVIGNPEGLQGQTYALPTVKERIAGPLSYDIIEVYVKRFIIFAQGRPDLHFLVTPIGCGLAGLDPKVIAPMFKPCMNMDNISLPNIFIEVLEGK